MEINVIVVAVLAIILLVAVFQMVQLVNMKNTVATTGLVSASGQSQVNQQTGQPQGISGLPTQRGGC